MQADDLPVFGELQVEFHERRALLRRELEGGNGVLGRVGGRAAMSDHPRFLGRVAIRLFA